MLLVASALVTKPALASHRFEILTALWCRYKPKDGTKTVSEDPKLIDWFAFGLFGRHTTPSEVDTWLEGCGKWLGDNTGAKPDPPEKVQ